MIEEKNATNQQPAKSNSFWESISGELRGIIITSVVGLTTLLITTTSNIWTKKFEYEAQEVQMKREFEYELLMKVFGQEDKKEAAKQLEFFIDAGFLEDKNGAIKEMVIDHDRIPLSLKSLSIDPENLTKSQFIYRDSLFSIMDSLSKAEIYRLRAINKELKIKLEK